MQRLCMVGTCRRNVRSRPYTDVSAKRPCTNVAGWAPVFPNTTPTNVLFYTDPDVGSLPMRFYRAFQFP